MLLKEAFQVLEQRTSSVLENMIIQKQNMLARNFMTTCGMGTLSTMMSCSIKTVRQIGRKSLFRDGFPHSECSINEHVFILRTNELCNQEFLFFWLDQPEMTQKIINLNSNAAQPGINQTGVKGLSILMPEKKILDEFRNIVDPMLGLLFNMAKKNKILAETRDLLLPRLVSGELDVISKQQKKINIEV